MKSKMSKTNRNAILTKPERIIRSWKKVCQKGDPATKKKAKESKKTIKEPSKYLTTNLTFFSPTSRSFERKTFLPPTFLTFLFCLLRRGILYHPSFYENK